MDPSSAKRDLQIWGAAFGAPSFILVMREYVFSRLEERCWNMISCDGKNVERLLAVFEFWELWGFCGACKQRRAWGGLVRSGGSCPLENKYARSRKLRQSPVLREEKFARLWKNLLDWEKLQLGQLVDEKKICCFCCSAEENLRESSSFIKKVWLELLDWEK